MTRRKFLYGFTKLYRRILDEIFDGEATDEQLEKAADLIFEIEDDEYSAHCRRVSENDAIEWIAKSVALVKSKESK
jgi:hypothetical protein